MRVVASDGVSLAAFRSGDGPPLYAIHGGPGSTHQGLAQYLALASSYRSLYLFDQRGCGESDDAAEQTYSLATLAQDIEDSRRHFGHDRIALLGHSLGGVIALRYAQRWPKNLECLVLVDCPIRGWVGILTSPRGWPIWIRAMTLAFGKSAEMKFHLRHELGNQRKRDEIRALLTRPCRFDPARIRRLNLAAFQPADLAMVIRAGVRVLGIYGREDKRFRADARYLSRLGARVEVIGGAGHWPMVEQPERFHTTLRRYLCASEERFVA
jgi:pimeloyl-ACP methyl ester carboxylesterase